MKKPFDLVDRMPPLRAFQRRTGEAIQNPKLLAALQNQVTERKSKQVLASMAQLPVRSGYDPTGFGW
jgi:hypothetical protein